MTDLWAGTRAIVEILKAKEIKQTFKEIGADSGRQSRLVYQVEFTDNGLQVVIQLSPVTDGSYIAHYKNGKNLKTKTKTYSNIDALIAGVENDWSWGEKEVETKVSTLKKEEKND